MGVKSSKRRVACAFSFVMLATGVVDSEGSAEQRVTNQGRHAGWRFPSSGATIGAHSIRCFRLSRVRIGSREPAACFQRSKAGTV
jgi:hypothetical protein